MRPNGRELVTAKNLRQLQPTPGSDKACKLETSEASFPSRPRAASRIRGPHEKSRAFKEAMMAHRWSKPFGSLRFPTQRRRTKTFCKRSTTSTLACLRCKLGKLSLDAFWKSVELV
ncbi:uncharacterized protein LOC142572336 [Dermacentor variabilis]|uniref:uncharacterized protein LOC142572336 n=1 Tax=Dermacentor variabilis TaxID=34621 RepID=UPI003F5C2D3A